VTAPLLRADGLAKRYGPASASVLDQAELQLAPGELVVLTGPSGSGKSTLLAILAGLDTADAGTVALPHGNGTGSGADATWRQLALVPQALGLLDDLPVDEAIGLPLRLSGVSRADEAAAVQAMLERLGLTRVRRRLPAEISLGEQQRTAIGRAIITEPDVLLLDEPTAHQDARSTRRIVDLLRERTAAGGAVLVATHDEAVVELADRVLRLAGGAVELA